MGSLESIGRALLSLALVLGVMWLLGRWVRRRGGGAARGGRGRHRDAVAVLGRQQLSRSSSVALVRVVDRAMVLGITDTQITLLGEAELAAVEALLDPPALSARARPVSSAPGQPLASVSARAGSAAFARPAAPAAGKALSNKALQGSALSPSTWSQALDALRDRTVRR